LKKKKTELWNLKGEDPKSFWKKLKSRKEKPNLTFSNIELSHYFSTLLNSEDITGSNESEALAPSVDAMTQNLYDETLNRDITLEEVKMMAKRFKSGKASGQSF